MSSDVDDRRAREQFGGGVNPEIERMIGELTPETLWLVRLWRHYRSGFLLRAGGLADQPNRYLEAMEILSGEVDRKQAEAMRRKAARQQGGGMKVHGAERMKRTRIV